MKFADIPQFTRESVYSVDVGWAYLEGTLTTFHESYKGGLLLCPDYQRGHVWTEDQQIAFVEFRLRGGKSGGDIFFNSTGFEDFSAPIELVDGLQRVTAVRRFMASEIPAFGCLFKDYEDPFDWMTRRFRVNINNLPTRADVLKWYLEMNTGGTPHTDVEIERVKALYAEAVEKGL